MNDGQIYYRVHWTGSPKFCARNASNCPWGAEQERDENGKFLPLRGAGYSCIAGPEGLVHYFESRGGALGERVVIFMGEWIGSGPDGEPLVIPDDSVRARWTTFDHLVDLLVSREYRYRAIQPRGTGCNLRNLLSLQAWIRDCNHRPVLSCCRGAI